MYCFFPWAHGGKSLLLQEIYGHYHYNFSGNVITKLIPFCDTMAISPPSSAHQYLEEVRIPNVAVRWRSKSGERADLIIAHFQSEPVIRGSDAGRFPRSRKFFLGKWYFRKLVSSSFVIKIAEVIRKNILPRDLAQRIQTALDREKGARTGSKTAMTFCCETLSGESRSFLKTTKTKMIPAAGLQHVGQKQFTTPRSEFESESIA